MRQMNLFNAPVKAIMDEPYDDVIRDMNNEHQTDTPFYVLDLGDIVQKIKSWRHKMPRVKIFYAVKCNSDPFVLKTLQALGTGFDCASKSEIKAIRDLGVEPSRIIYAHPTKTISHIVAAISYGVDLMTFDSKSELHKIKQYCPQARLVLRIRCDAVISQCPLGIKFGILPNLAFTLLEEAQKLNLNLVGVSFHVGSGCQEPPVFLRAIKECRYVIDLAKDYGFNMTILDIGGGFPGSSGNTLDELAYYVNRGLDEYFPDENEVKVMAEPGRYVVASAFTLITKVISVKSEEQGCGQPFAYYMNDGVYGSFNCVIFDHQSVEPQVMKEITSDEPLYSSKIWGPTCDSFDQIMSDVQLPKLELGDSIYWRDMGAYTLAAASKFNGFVPPEVKMVVPTHIWHYLDLQLQELDLAVTEEIIEQPIHAKSFKPYFATQVLKENLSCIRALEKSVNGTE